MIQFENVSKSVGGVAVLTGVTFEVPTGELVVLAGPSGCGKTTTLKMINRLIAPTSGRVLIDGEDVARQQVLTLRRFRDQQLKKTALGRLFIRVYYRLSPPAAARLRNARHVNRLVRRCLDRWVQHLEQRQ